LRRRERERERERERDPDSPSGWITREKGQGRREKPPADIAGRGEKREAGTREKEKKRPGRTGYRIILFLFFFSFPFPRFFFFPFFLLFLLFFLFALFSFRFAAPSLVSPRHHAYIDFQKFLARRASGRAKRKAEIGGGKKRRDETTHGPRHLSLMGGYIR